MTTGNLNLRRLHRERPRREALAVLSHPLDAKNPSGRYTRLTIVLCNIPSNPGCLDASGWLVNPWKCMLVENCCFHRWCLWRNVTTKILLQVNHFVRARRGVEPWITMASGWHACRLVWYFLQLMTDCRSQKKLLDLVNYDILHLYVRFLIIHTFFKDSWYRKNKWRLAFEEMSSVLFLSLQWPFPPL